MRGSSPRVSLAFSSVSLQTGERPANQDGVLLVDLTPMEGDFRKRLFPGAWINLLKRGASVSVGRHDATVNIGSKGVRETFGLRGTGLSYTTRRIPYRGDPRMGIVLLILSAIILILVYAITASGANPEPYTPPHDSTLAWCRTLTQSILYGDKAVAESLMASQISVCVSPGTKPPRLFAGRFIDALHKEFDKHKSVTFEIDDSSFTCSGSRSNRQDTLLEVRCRIEYDTVVDGDHATRHAISYVALCSKKQDPHGMVKSLTLEDLGHEDSL